MKYIFKLLIVTTTLCWVMTSSAQEIIHYKNLPVSIHLYTGEERSIIFGDHVRVGQTKGQQLKGLFRVQAAQGVVHILARKEFDTQRLQFKRESDGRVIILDLVSSDRPKGKPELEDIRVLLDFENTVDQTAAIQQTDERDFPIITPVELTRYASQRLFGPSRLHHDKRGITETTLGVNAAIKIFKGVNKFATISEPIVAYQGGGYYLAGIHIKNKTTKSIKLDYLDLSLPYSHATFQHHSLGPIGSPGDSTVLYLITERPLKDSLYPWTYYLDRQAEMESNASNQVREERAEGANGRRIALKNQ